MTSDVIRRHYMSYNPLFHNCLHGHNFAKSEPIDGLEHLPTDSCTPLTSRSNPPEVDSLFKRTEQVVFLYDRNYSAIQKTNLPSLTVGGFSSKVGKSDGESKTTQKQKSMEKKQARRTGRKPKTDPADYKYNFRLNAQEKSRFEKLFLESGARDRTIFIKKSIFSEQLKVIKVDKVSMDYYIRLGEFYRQFQAIGNNYNQVVRAVQKNFGEKRAMSLLYKLEKATLELILLNKQIMALTKEYEQKWLQR